MRGCGDRGSTTTMILVVPTIIAEIGAWPLLDRVVCGDRGTTHTANYCTFRNSYYGHIHQLKVQPLTIEATRCPLPAMMSNKTIGHIALCCCYHSLVEQHKDDDHRRVRSFVGRRLGGESYSSVPRRCYWVGCGINYCRYDYDTRYSMYTEYMACVGTSRRPPPAPLNYLHGAGSSQEVWRSTWRSLQNKSMVLIVGCEAERASGRTTVQLVGRVYPRGPLRSFAQISYRRCLSLVVCQVRDRSYIYEYNRLDPRVLSVVSYKCTRRHVHNIYRCHFRRDCDAIHLRVLLFRTRRRLRNKGRSTGKSYNEGLPCGMRSVQSSSQLG